MLMAGTFAAFVLASLPSLAAGQPVHLRGTITNVSATGFTVQTSMGAKKVVVAAGTRITGVVPSTIEKIQPGSFIGSANVPHGNRARALEVVVFPPAMKGSGLGDYTWDLPTHEGTGSAMTNGTVKSSEAGAGAMAQSAMTNGTVKAASGTWIHTVVVDYGKGEKTIEVTADTPVVTFKPVDRSALVNGAHVFVAGAPGNPVAAAVVAVGLDGTVPPM
jgi:hypothetical protein